MVHHVAQEEEVPQDINAFFGHPFNSTSQNNDGAKALLHEYKSLPAIDKTCGNSFTDTECVETQEYDKLPYDDCIFSIKSEGSTGDSQLANEEGVADTFHTQEQLENLVAEVEASTDSFSADNTSTDSGSGAADARVNSEEDDLKGFDEVFSMFMNGDGEAADGMFDSIAPESCSSNINQSESVLSPVPHISSTVIPKDENGNTIGSRTVYSDICISPKIEPQHPATPAMPATATPTDQQVASAVALDPALLDKVSPQFYMHHPQTLHPQVLPGHMVTQPAARIGQNMNPRFMNPMVVLTSTSGPLQVRPFITDEQIGITQVMPIRAPLQPMYPHHPHMGMAWNPHFHPYGMSVRMMAPEVVRMPASAPMCYPTDFNLMLQPGMPIHTNMTVAGAPMTHPQMSMQPHFSMLPNHIPACPLIKVQPKAYDGKVVFSDEHKESIDCLHQANDSSLVNVVGKKEEPDSDCSQSDDMLQKACAMSNIQQISVSSQYLHLPVSAGHLKSPDSGFGESHAELVPSSSESEICASNPGSPSNEIHRPRKRRSSVCSYSKQCKLFNNGISAINYAKRENDNTGYELQLEAATSCGAKLEDDRMTYLNKGQFYTLVLKNTLPPECITSTLVQSVVTVRFRDELTTEASRKCWTYWHSRQAEDGDARAIELDVKRSENLSESSLFYNGVNALSFKWDPHDHVKAQIAVHCLSTDFSSQKGVKGLPLHIQVDTYDEGGAIYPVHRAYAQIKIFCDKGAERKTRDEERRKEKASKPNDSSGIKCPNEQLHPIVENTHFYSMADLTSEAFVYTSSFTIPPEALDDLPLKDFEIPIESGEDLIPSVGDGEFLMSTKQKRPRLGSPHQVLLYVRENDETTFNALLLSTPNTQGLYSAIKDKYTHISEIRMVYKKTSKGLLVKVDDNIVRHFIHESMYVVEFKEYPGSEYDVTLEETDR